MKITTEQARIFFNSFKLNPKKISLVEWTYGMNVELEHGRVNRRTNVTNDNFLKTAKIALVHIMEFPDYYKRLKKLESNAEKFWKGKDKNIFLSKGGKKKSKKSKKSKRSCK